MHGSRTRAGAAVRASRRVTLLILALSVLAAATSACEDPRPPLADHCDAEEYDGQPVDETATGVEPVDQNTGDIDALYPLQDTSLDTWYGGSECEWSVGGDVPPEAANPDIDGELHANGVSATAGDLAGELNRVGDEVLSTVQGLTTPSDLQAAPCDGNTFQPPQPGSPTPGKGAPGANDCYRSTAVAPALDPNKPFSGRDIIFVHGLDTEPVFDVAKSIVDPAVVSWPQNLSQFYLDTGFWKDKANKRWSSHITRNLKGGNFVANPSNRYLTVAWPSTQHLIYGVNAMLNQVADAMNTGQGVVPTNPFDPAGKQGFCAGGCVVVSHSTGGLITDAAMALANETKTDPALRNALGNIGYIPDHMRAQVALHDAFSGSHLATVLVALGLAPGVITTTAFCQLGTLVANAFLNGTFTGCAGFGTFPQSVLFDLVPAVTKFVWGPWIDRTPVATLTTAGGHPTSVGTDAEFSHTPLKAFSFLRPLVLRGFDDGVLSSDSQCATPNPEALTPNGYVSKASGLDAALNAAAPAGVVTPFVRRVFDMGYPARGVWFYVDQVVDRRFAPQLFAGVSNPSRFTPFFVASECTPYVAPDGMVQPVNHAASGALWAASPTSPLARYKNHYSFLISTADHFVGPVGPFGNLCYEATQLIDTSAVCQGSGLDNKEEVRVITDNFVYTSGLVSSAVKKMVVENIKGRKLPKIGKKGRTRWIWKRVYHRLKGWENLIEDDYVYRYVLR